MKNLKQGQRVEFNNQIQKGFGEICGFYPPDLYVVDPDDVKGEFTHIIALRSEVWPIETEVVREIKAGDSVTFSVEYEITNLVDFKTIRLASFKGKMGTVLSTKYAGETLVCDVEFDNYIIRCKSDYFSIV